MDEIHIGKAIHEKIKEQGRKMTWLAGQLNCDRTNIYKILKKPHLDSELLLRISKILDHDFFNFYSEDVKNSGKPK